MSPIIPALILAGFLMLSICVLAAEDPTKEEKHDRETD